MRRRGLGAALLAAAIAACGTGAGAGDDEPIRVLAASSLVPVLEQIAGSSPTPYVVSGAGSQVLAAQVRAGVDADVLVLADGELAAELTAEELASPASPLVMNLLAVVAPPGAPAPAIADLADPSRRVVLADISVPLGAHTRRALRELEVAGHLPDGTSGAVEDGVDSLEDSASSVLAKVLTGEAEVAVVYASDATRMALPSVPLEGRPVTVTIQLVSDRGAAADLVAWLTDPARDGTWAEAGFLPISQP